MEFSIGIIAIKGDHLDKVEKIFNAFDYVDKGDDKTFKTWSEAGQYLFDKYFEHSNRDIALRGIWLDNTWTIICDPEMADMTEDSKVEELSKLTHSDIWTFMIQTSSGSFSFARFNPRKMRYFFTINGEIVENEGQPLPEEKGLNINDSIQAIDLISLGKTLGFSIEPNEAGNFTVKHLPYGEQMKQQLAEFKQSTTTTPETDENKPWWKIW